MNRVHAFLPLRFSPVSPRSHSQESMLDRMLSDGSHSVSSVVATLRVLLGEQRSLDRSSQFGRAVADVACELIEIERKFRLSHVVLYGTSRRQVAAAVLLAGAIADQTSLVISPGIMAPEALIAEHLEHRVPSEVIGRLPLVLDGEVAAPEGIPPDVWRALYFNSRLIAPYQIDTDRYPFTNRFV